MKGRSIAAVFAGIAVGAILGYILGPIVENLYAPKPEVIEEIKGNRNAFIELYRNQPAGFHLLNIGVGLLKLIVALLVGSLIEKKDLMIPLVIGAFWLLMALLGTFAWPNPMWYGIVYIPSVIGITIAYIYWKRKAQA